MIEVAICDDEPVFARTMERLLRDSARHIPEPLHIRAFTTGAEVLAELPPPHTEPPAETPGEAPLGGRPSPFDIIFLDIELGDANGIAIATEIRKRFQTVILVFVSAYEGYWRRVFGSQPLEFLSKPVDALQLQDTLRKAYVRLKEPSLYYSYRIKSNTFRVPLAEIVYFETLLRKIRIATLYGEQEFYGKLDDVEAALPKSLSRSCFARVHHSLLVNLEHVEQIAKNSDLVMRGGRTVSLSRAHAGDVRRQMAAYYADTWPEGVPR
jgi:DNA-binding LytR/AlgR family response regulator